jgi:hypothetical protein
MRVVRLSVLRTGRLYSQELFQVLISVRGWVDPRAICGRKCFCHWKIAVIPSGMELTVFQFEAQGVKSGGPEPPYYRGFTITLRHTTLGRTPLEGWSARRKTPLPDNTQHSQPTDIRAPGRIRTHNPSKRAAADPGLRQRGHRDLHLGGLV